MNHSNNYIATLSHLLGNYSLTAKLTNSDRNYVAALNRYYKLAPLTSKEERQLNIVNNIDISSINSTKLTLPPIKELHRMTIRRLFQHYNISRQDAIQLRKIFKENF